jgi:hypothetical protein
MCIGGFEYRLPLDWDLAKNPPDMLAAGAVAKVVVTSGVGVVAAGGTAAIGWVVQAAAAGSTTARVKLMPAVAGTPTVLETPAAPNQNVRERSARDNLVITNRRYRLKQGETGRRFSSDAVAGEQALKKFGWAVKMTSDSSDRGTRLTFEIFPSILFVSYELAGYVEEIIDQHEDRIRQAVLDVLGGGSFNFDSVSPEVIFTAVAQLGMALYCVALDQMAWVDDNNPPESYDQIADRPCQEVIDFVVRKYTSAVSEIPGRRRTCRRTWKDELRRVLLQVREKTKGEVHASSMRSKELEKWIVGGRLTPPPEHIAPYVDVKSSSGETPAEGPTRGEDSRSTADVISLRKGGRKTSKLARRSSKPKFHA